MDNHLHFLPELLQGKLNMPPCCAACLPVPLADFLLRIVPEIVQENFFLLLLWQHGQGGSKGRVAYQNNLSASCKGIILVY